MTIKDEFYTEEEILDFLGISPSRLRSRRCEAKDHPPYLSLGKRRIYPKKEFAAWLKSRPLKKAIA